MYDDLDLDWVDLLSTDPTDYKVTDGQIDELFGKDQIAPPKAQSVSLLPIP